MKIFLILSLVAVCFSSPLPGGRTNEAENGAKIESDARQNAWELSGYFQGDIILTPEQRDAIEKNTEVSIGRNGATSLALRWPNKTIPYTFEESDFNGEQMSFIEETLKLYAEISCVNIRPKQAGDVHYVHITGDPIGGCGSQVGRVGGKQYLNYAPDSCLTSRTILHEFLHAFGFWHQQSSTERDDYVKINWANIQPGMEYKFAKLSAFLITNFGVKYDYDSIMHYGEFAFSYNGKRTIVPLDPNAQIGVADTLSPKDIEKLNLMYCK